MLGSFVLMVGEDTFPSITAVLKEHRAVPLSIFSIAERGTGDRRIIIRCKAPKQKAVMEGLRQAGFTVEKVTPLRWTI